MRRLLCFPAAGSAVLLALGTGAGAQGQPRTDDAFHAPAAKYPVIITDPVKLPAGKHRHELAVRVYAPDAPGRFPVLVFSHGLGGSRTSFAPLARYWASQGYVSVHPAHPDDPARGVSVGPRRARELSAVIDGLDDLEKAVPGLKGKLDRKRIGVAGNGFGALAAMLAGGATLDLSEAEKDRTYLDPRVRAVLAISGPGPGKLGLTNRSWRKLYVPMLTLTGTLDREADGKGPEWRRQVFELSRPGDKYHVFLEGATPFSFGGELAGGGLASGGLSPAQRVRLRGGRRVGFAAGLAHQDFQFEATKAASLAFWNAYLKNDTTAKVSLLSGRLAAETSGKARVEHR
jgi:predicted dienelactone hydrolase